MEELDFISAAEESRKHINTWVAQRTEGEDTLLFLLSWYFLINFIGVQLIYSVVVVSGVQQSESVIPIHRSTLF